ncbi:MAG: hypothetical protein NT030_07120 [Candidatus Saganbacteria bacterium]|nr:hypothetical protein [Candidatus Saganbacteria bacterium]
MIEIAKLPGNKKGLYAKMDFKIKDLAHIIKDPARSSLVNVSLNAKRILGLRGKQFLLGEVVDKTISCERLNKNGSTSKTGGIFYAEQVLLRDCASRINIDFIMGRFSLSTRIHALAKRMPITESVHYVFSSINSAGEQVGKDGKVSFDLGLLPRKHKRPMST